MRTTDANLPVVRRLEIELTVTQGPLQGSAARAKSDQRLRVGRCQSCSLRVFDPRMSRNHFEAKFAEGRWWITDLSSSNGTLLRGQRISEPTEVFDGDIVIAGDTEFRVLINEGKLQTDGAVLTSHLQNLVSSQRPTTTTATVVE